MTKRSDGHSNGTAKQRQSHDGQSGGSAKQRQNNDRHEKSPDIRMLAVDTLIELEKHPQPAHYLIHGVLEQYSHTSERDRAFYRRLVEGVIEQRIRLDFVIDCYAKLKVRKMKPLIRQALRIGVYQILEMNSVPDSAAVNESVRLVSRRGFSSLRGFVNGLLRNIVRNRESIPFPARKDGIEYLHIQYSMPKEMLSLWIEHYGFDLTERICAASSERPEITVRLRNGLRCADAPEELREAAYQLEATYADDLQNKTNETVADDAPNKADAKFAVDSNISAYLIKPSGLEASELFQTGKYTVQDISSMLCVLVAGIWPGMRILDLCAAPGGKALFAADLVGANGSVKARDLTEFKIDMIESNLQRCHRESNVETELWDATRFDPASEGQYDLVIADLPCSGLGVIRRKPDIKYNTSMEQWDSLVQLQREILNNAVRYVKPGGILLYSTCTINPSENEENRQWILDTFPEFLPQSIRETLPEAIARESVAAGLADTRSEGYLQLLPGIHRCDGFFISIYRRSR